MVYATLDLEKDLWEKGHKLVCGIDEVGRGCFAGPVVTGAVVFSPDVKLPTGIADSKLLKPKERERLAEEIKQNALLWSIAEVSVEVINKIGIGKATQQAFVESVKKLTHMPDFILIDAFYITDLEKEKQMPVKGGDKLSASIAAASIIAKVYRDELMAKLHTLFPHYGFDINKGYGTKKHREAIKKHGLCDLHRTSFHLSQFL